MTALGFLNPWLLLGLIALPLLIWLLRAVPPAARRFHFPGLALLNGLEDRQSEAARTPWWLLALRILALALIIIGFAGPILNPRDGIKGDGPLLILADGTWAQAQNWEDIQQQIDNALTEAEGRSVAVKLLTSQSEVLFQTPENWRGRVAGLQPAAWAPNYSLEGLAEAAFDTLWLTDGLAREGQEALAEQLQSKGTLTVLEPVSPLYALRPPRFDEGEVVLDVLRRDTSLAENLTIEARGTDPAGLERVLMHETASFEAGQSIATLRFAPPPELRNRLSRFEIENVSHAGAIALTDDRLRRRKVALVGNDSQETLTLLSPLHYLREALRKDADLFEGNLSQSLSAKPDLILLPDVANLPAEDHDALSNWVAEGGVLVRFAGPRLAASNQAFSAQDPLLPVRLRAGGRSLNGALSWGEPKKLSPFAEGSPFFGLPIPSDITVQTQVIAEPSPALAEKVISALEDGTPLVTRAYQGQGQVVLFHVAANAGWSNLPVSELFIQMLQRLAMSAGSLDTPELLEGTFWTPDQTLTAYGTLIEPENLTPIAGETLTEHGPSADVPAGLYAGESRRIAVNAVRSDELLTAANWPLGTVIMRGDEQAAQPLKGWLLSAALGLLLVDCLATLVLSGRLRGSAAAVMLLFLLWPAPPAQAVEDPFAATRQVTLAYVATGDQRIDDTLRSGLEGLGQVLSARTTIHTGAPIAIDIENDELAFFPLLYWPVTENTPLPSREAYARLNLYLQTGGMILFDTRDADLGGFGTTPASKRLQTLALGLDVPQLEPLPSDHILTRTFYLLKSIAGRYASGDVWVEQSTPPSAEGEVRGQNDNVTPVVIGANDWAAAWASQPDGTPLYQVGSGLDGAAQREAAYRFGVNLVMHVLTGNYKSDQVHVPELLERLGR